MCVVSRAGGSGGVALKGACTTNISAHKVCVCVCVCVCVFQQFVKISVVTDTTDQTLHHPETVLHDFTVTIFIN